MNKERLAVKPLTDAELDEIIAGNVDGVEPTTQEISMALELRERRCLTRINVIAESAKQVGRLSSGAEQLTAMINADGVRYHMLTSVVIEAKVRKGVTEITFGTKCVDVINAVDARETVGIVLWIPRKVYDGVIKGGAV